MAAQTLIAPNFYNLEPNHLISMIGDELRTTSLKVAEAFGKLHKDVLRKIGNLDCSPEFASAHFYANVENQAVGTSRRDMKYYEMTKDGFMFLVMGFTGKKAAQIKEAYINAFNWMAAQLFGRPVAAKTTTDARTPLRAAVSMLVGKRSLMYPDAYALVHQRFGVEHIDQLAPEQIGQAVEYVHRLVLEGEVLPAEKVAPVGAGMQDISGLCNHMAWLSAWWDQFGPAIRELSPRLAGRVHDHFNDGMAFASNVSSRAGIDLPDRGRLENHCWLK